MIVLSLSISQLETECLIVGAGGENKTFNYFWNEFVGLYNCSKDIIISYYITAVFNPSCLLLDRSSYRCWCWCPLPVRV